MCVRVCVCACVCACARVCVFIYNRFRGARLGSGLVVPVELGCLRVYLGAGFHVCVDEVFVSLFAARERMNVCVCKSVCVGGSFEFWSP